MLVSLLHIWSVLFFVFFGICTSDIYNTSHTLFSRLYLFDDFDFNYYFIIVLYCRAMDMYTQFE